MSGQDAWAVGWSGTGTYRPVVLHWDGRSWSVATVTGIPDMVVLRSVVATGPGQVWVSGLALTPVLGSMSVSGVVYRLEGSRWVRIPLPAGLDPGSLYHGPGDQIWTIGASTGIAGPGDGAPVIADWTGREWHVAYTAPGGAYYDLQSLDIVTSRDGWAAGYTQARAPECFESLHQCRDFSVKSPLLLHWDGASWKREAPPPVPASYSGGGALSYLAAVPASPQRWATGTVFSAAPLFVGTSWLLRWNGTAWTTVTMPVVSLQGQYLYDLDGRWIVAQGVITPSWTPLPDSGMHVIAIPGTRAIGTRATWAIGTAPGNGTTGAPYIEYSALPS